MYKRQVNADEIEKTIRKTLKIQFSEFSVTSQMGELRSFLRQSTLLAQADLTGQIDQLTFDENGIGFELVAVNSYWASVISDYIRHQLLANGTSFTFETVMSSPDKVAFLCKARAQGFRTYLYYVATEDSAINIERVRQRVASGGHAVATDKIISRYQRSLSHLAQAVECADRAYLFDNSGHERLWVAEATHGLELEMKCEQMPHWFKNCLLYTSDAADE